ncbi:MAG: GlsB/YeaQ/YmgE family stress response membrane protein [Pirellulales bacterium]
MIGWLLVGLFAGLLGRLLVPGRQPMGIFKTMGLGLLGSLLGGFISSALFGTDPTDPGFHPAGLLMSTVGAVILLAGYISYKRRHISG